MITHNVPAVSGAHKRDQDKNSNSPPLITLAGWILTLFISTLAAKQSILIKIIVVHNEKSLRLIYTDGEARLLARASLLFHSANTNLNNLILSSSSHERRSQSQIHTSLK